MEQQLKQRLVGVAVIFSLAVIFLPMLLDGSGTRPKHLKVSIPVPPEVSSYEIVEEKIIELKNKVERIPQPETVFVDEISDPVDDPEPVQEVEQSNDSDKKEITQKLPAIIQQAETKAAAELVKTENREVATEQSGGASWVIQVGSFSEKNKAYTQRDKLRKSGLAAVFIEKFQHDGVLSYRVRMGPFISRDKAKVVGNKVRAKYNIKGLVMRYEK
mgnify:CR=1 FL=1